MSGKLFFFYLSLAISCEKRIGPHSMDCFKSYKLSLPENVPVEAIWPLWGDTIEGCREEGHGGILASF